MKSNCTLKKLLEILLKYWERRDGARKLHCRDPDKEFDPQLVDSGKWRNVTYFFFPDNHFFKAERMKKRNAYRTRTVRSYLLKGRDKMTDLGEGQT